MLGFGIAFEALGLEVTGFLTGYSFRTEETWKREGRWTQRVLAKG